MKIKEKIVIAIAILAYAGFQVTVRVMNAQVRSESRPSTLQEGIEGNYVQLTVHSKAKYDLKDFQAIQTGMTFSEVTKAMHLTGLKQNIGDEVPNPKGLDALVIFKNVDGSSIDLVFHQDRVVSKRRLSDVMNEVVKDESERI